MVSIGVLVNGFPQKEGQAYRIEWLYQAMQKLEWKTQFLPILLMMNEETSVLRKLGRAKHNIVSLSTSLF